MNVLQKMPIATMMNMKTSNHMTSNSMMMKNTNKQIPLRLRILKEESYMIKKQNKRGICHLLINSWLNNKNFSKRITLTKKVCKMNKIVLQ